MSLRVLLLQLARPASPGGRRRGEVPRHRRGGPGGPRPRGDLPDTAAYPGALPEETVAGVRYRAPGRALLDLLRPSRRTPPRAHDVVVDVQNGVPYLSPLVTRTPVVNLVHHVHREQWPVVFGPRTARFGWWLESRLRAPGLQRHELRRRQRLHDAQSCVDLGVDPERGDDHPQRHGCRRRRRMPSGHRYPRVVVLGRPRAAEAGRARPRRRGSTARAGARAAPGRRRAPAGGSPSCESTSPPSASRTT